MCHESLSIILLRRAAYRILQSARDPASQSLCNIAAASTTRQNLPQGRFCLFSGGYYARIEPEAKGLVKKRMTVDEYLEHEPEEEKANSKQISSILGSEMEVWTRVHWRLSEKLFYVWYIWLKDNFGEVKEWVEELKNVTEDK